MKGHGTLNNFFERNARRLVFSRVDINARARTALQLFAAFRSQNDQAVLGINFLRLGLVCCLDSFFANFGSHRLVFVTSELETGLPLKFEIYRPPKSVRVSLSLDS